MTATVEPPVVMGLKFTLTRPTGWSSSLSQTTDRSGIATANFAVRPKTGEVYQCKVAGAGVSATTSVTC